MGAQHTAPQHMAAADHGTEQHSDHAEQQAAHHEPNILSVPGDMLFSHMAGDVLGDVAALRTVSRTCRTNAALVVQAAAQSAHLQLHGAVEPDEAHALGAALGSALSQCQHPKHMGVSISGRRNKQQLAYQVLKGMRQSGAHRHVAALQLASLQPAVPTLENLAEWPYLTSLKITSPVEVMQGLGSSIASLTGLQSLSLKLSTRDQGLPLCEHTLHASHLRQLTQLTALCLGVESLQGPPELASCAAAMPLLQHLDLNYAGATNPKEVAAAVLQVLPTLTSLTSLSFDIRKASVQADSRQVEGLLNAAAALPSLCCLALPGYCLIDQYAHALSGLTTLNSLRLNDLYICDEPQAAQLLSRLTRLEVGSWIRNGCRIPGRASWLANLKEVAVEYVDLAVMADLPPGVCIKQAGEVPVTINCRENASVADVGAAAERLRGSSAVAGCTGSVLDVTNLHPVHCTAVKPLAEAVEVLHGLESDLVPHMAGWHLRGFELAIRDAQEMAQAVVGGASGRGRLSVDVLRVDVGWDTSKLWTRQKNMDALKQLCKGLRGLQRVVLVGPTPAVKSPQALAWCEQERQGMLLVLQQAVAGRGGAVVARARSDDA